MNSSTIPQLREWAEHHAPRGYVQAVQVLDVLAEMERLHAFTLQLAERLACASEVLGRVAERRKGKGGIGAIVGKWPGDETDEEIQKALERLS